MDDRVLRFWKNQGFAVYETLPHPSFGAKRYSITMVHGPLEELPQS